MTFTQAELQVRPYVPWYQEVPPAVRALGCKRVLPCLGKSCELHMALQ